MNEQTVPSAAATIRVGNLEIRYLQEAGDGRQMGCFEMRVPPNATVPPPHRHPGNEELVYVLEGMLRYTVDGTTRDLRVGDCMATPRGAVHAFTNPYTEAVRALVVNDPDIGSDYLARQRNLWVVMGVSGAVQPLQSETDRACDR